MKLNDTLKNEQRVRLYDEIQTFLAFNPDGENALAEILYSAVEYPSILSEKLDEVISSKKRINL